MNSKKEIVTEEQRLKLQTDEDYILAPAFSNSIQKWYVDSKKDLKDAAIARMLGMDTEEMQRMYQMTLKKLKDLLTERSE